MTYYLSRRQIDHSSSSHFAYNTYLHLDTHQYSSSHMANQAISLEGIPQEILERIAFFIATAEFLGPPKGILSLLLINHTIYSHLSPISNPHLYGRIFEAKFDIVHATRRLGSNALVAGALSDELQRRCIFLTRIRRRSDSKILRSSLFAQDEDAVRDLLWTAYLLMVENDGKNAEQLRSYARMDIWLKEYWFDPDGASLATRDVKMGVWPSDNELNAIAMWLFWFLFKPGEYCIFRLYLVSLNIY